MVDKDCDDVDEKRFAFVPFHCTPYACIILVTPCDACLYLRSCAYQPSLSELIVRLAMDTLNPTTQPGSGSATDIE